MYAVTLAEAKKNLEELIHRAIADAEPTIIATDGGEQVVFLSLGEFNSWQETLYLLSTPANAARIRRSIAEARAGNLWEAEWEQLESEIEADAAAGKLEPLLDDVHSSEGAEVASGRMR
jgi:antitoxin YefM